MIHFRGGEIQQKGKGIGSFFRGLINMLRPIARSVGSNLARAATSDTAKDMAKTLREQAIDSTLNMTKDYLNGNDMQHSIDSMMDFKQFDNDEDNVDMSSDNETDTEDESEMDTEDTHNESDTEDKSESDTEDQDLLEIINDIKATFNYSLQLRKKFREKIEDMEEYEQEEWKKILKSYAKLEASVKDEIEGLDSVDKGEQEEEDKKEGDDEEETSTKEDFWDFIKEFKHALNDKDLKRVETYFDKEAEKMEESKIVEDDEGIKDEEMVIEKVDELKDDFNELGSDCFNHCSEEKIRCLTSAVNSMLQLGSTVMNRQKLKFIRELMLPYHETVRKIGNPKVSSHEKRKLLQKAQVGGEC